MQVGRGGSLLRIAVSLRQISVAFFAIFLPSFIAVDGDGDGSDGGCYDRRASVINAKIDEGLQPHSKKII